MAQNTLEDISVPIYLLELARIQHNDYVGHTKNARLFLETCIFCNNFDGF